MTCQGPPSRGVAPKCSAAALYPQSQKAPSVYFMMLPLCTSVTDVRPRSIAYWIAAFTRRSVPSCEIGLIPKPAVSGKRTFLKSSGNVELKPSLNFLQSSEPAWNSMPA